MRNIILILMICMVNGLKAGDLVYSINAMNGSAPVTIDSILCENISNHTRILFGNLPAEKEYLINLTQKGYWGTTASVNRMESAFSLVYNQPGQVIITTGQGTVGKGAVTVFNLLGQKLFEENPVHFSPRQKLSLEIGLTGFFLVRVENGREIRSLKVQGNSSSGNFRFSVLPGSSEMMNLKNGSITGTDDFQYIPGDSIRISIYKKSFYSYPKSFRITRSEKLTFEMVTNTSATTGISNAYVDIYGKYEMQSFDIKTGMAVFRPLGNPPEWKPGEIFVAENDSSGYLRRVISAVKKDGMTVLQTIPAGLHEVFVNKDLKMSTLWMDPLSNVSDKNSPAEISKALTDSRGIAHPVLYIFQSPGAQKIVYSPLTFPGSDKPVHSTVHLQQDFPESGLYADNLIQVSLENGYVSSTQEADLSFSFRGNGHSDEMTKSDLGEMDRGMIILNGQGNAKGKFTFTAAGIADLNLPSGKMMNGTKITIKFLIEGIPVWIDLICDLYRKMNINSLGNFNANWSFDETHIFTSGWEYVKEKGNFSPVFSCTPESKVFSLTASGNSDAIALVSIFPSTEVRIYEIPVMSGKLMPSSKMEYSAGNHQVSTSSGAKSFLAWNSQLVAGFDHQTTADVEVFGISGMQYDSGPTTCSSTITWTSPVKLSLLTVFTGKVNLSSTVSLRFKITDKSGFAVPDCAVFIQGEGSYNDQLSYSNSVGEVTFEWTVGSKPGYNNFTAQIYNSDKAVISSVRDSVEVYDKDAYGTLVYEGRNYKTKKYGSAVWMLENLATLPAVSSPTPGSGNQPYYYVPGYYGTNTEEAKKVPGYNLYGVMYNWMAATRGEVPLPDGIIRGICPPGWHIPGEKDWADLWSYLVNNGYAFGGSGNRIAKTLASKTNWSSSGISGTPGNDPGSNNSSEFNGLPGGFRCTDALNFVQEGMFTSWWAASARDAENGNHWGFSNNTSVLVRYYSLKARGYFVRCVKD